MNEEKLPTYIQSKIIEIIGTIPSVTTNDLAAELGKEPWTVRYHINNITDMGLARAENVDNSSRWYAVAGKMGKVELT